MTLHKAKQFNFKETDDRMFDQFFVWNEERIYIMDNHRAALWCWLNEIKKAPKVNLKVLHIDNHLDMSPRGLHCNCATDVSFEKLGIGQYLKLQHNCEQYSSTQIFSYENYLRFFAQSYPHNIKSTNIFVTQHHWETKPHIDPAIARSQKKYLNNVNISTDCSQVAKRLYKSDLIELFEKDQYSKWIVDLDFDYFYNEETNKLNIKLAEEIIQYTKKWYDKNKIIALTVAWSSEFLIDRRTEEIRAGLKKAKKLNTIFSKIFNLDFPEV